MHGNGETVSEQARSKTQLVRYAGGLLLMSTAVPDGARAAELFLGVPICEASSGSGGGEFFDFDVDDNTAAAAADVVFGEVGDSSAFVELRTDFTPILTAPATVTVGPVSFFGELTGFGGGGLIKGSVRITVTLRDETAGVELGSEVLLDEEEPGDFLSTVISQIDSDFNPPTATFQNVDLVKDRDYAVIARLQTDAEGLGSASDFSFAFAPVDFGCVVAVAELDDSDGDGLYDDWEQNGVDVDGNGTIDIDLPAFGADPLHKDLFFEIDWVTGFAPTQSDVLNIKQAFAAAPIDAGGTPNPDGLPGIDVWLDTGSASDPTASEDGAGTNSCGDGLDNGIDGESDASDPDCLVGDDLGGGNDVGALSIGPLDANFYAAKAGNFTPERRGLFRFGLQASPADAVSPFTGGRAERGGDDLVVYNRLPGSMFHEIGHTLGLAHGGFESANCKPSYVSVMNYHHQLGIRLTGGTGGQDLDADGAPDGRILDYSPPRFAGGRGQAPLATLDETDLDDGIVLDATDPINQFAFTNDSGRLTRAPLDAPADWDSNGATTELDQMIDVDIDGIDGPSGCAENAGLTPDPPGLAAHDDWTNLQMPLLLEGDLLDAPVNPVEDPEPGEQELFALERAFNTTDLHVQKSDAPDPVEVGDPLTYTVSIDNQGPNPASRVVLVDDLPANVAVLALDAGCAQQPGGQVHCELGELLFGDHVDLQLVVDTSDVCVDGLPPLLLNLASVSNQPKYAGPDLDPGDNDASAQTTAVDTTPPVIACNAAAAISPPDAPIAFTATGEDLCDDAVFVEVTAYDCFKIAPNGKHIDKTHSCVITLDGPSVVIEDSGGVGDHIAWTVTAVDASGNAAVAACETMVVNPAPGP